MNKTRKFITLFVLLLMATVNNLTAQFSGGSGTEQDPYLISNVDDLQELSDSVNTTPANVNIFTYEYRDNWSRGKYFMLTNDIIEDSVKKPIGGGSGMLFQGVFDGNNKSINLAMDGHGLFFYLGPSAIVKNLILRGYVKRSGGTVSSLGRAMSIREDDGEIRISNVINLANISGITNIAGIILFSQYNLNENTTRCIVENCINYGLIEGAGGIGGITGIARYMTIKNCLNFGVLIKTGHPIDNRIGCISYLVLPSTTVINCHYDKQMCGGDD